MTKIDKIDTLDHCDDAVEKILHAAGCLGDEYEDDARKLLMHAAVKIQCIKDILERQEEEEEK